MSVIKEGIRRAIVRVRLKGSIIPKNTSISPRATIVKSCFEGLNTVGGGCRIVFSQVGFGSYVSNDTELLTAKVGRYCSIGPHVLMPTGKHPISEFASSSPLFYSSLGINGTSFVGRDKFEEYAYVEEGFSRVVGNDVWIGGGAIILEGVSIGDGAIIGAGSVVAKSIPAYSVALGVPARAVRYRFDESTVERLLNACWWKQDPRWIKEHAELFENVDLLLDELGQ